MDLVGEKVFLEEMKRIMRCECCGKDGNDYLYIVKKNMCIVMSHLCEKCGEEMDNLSIGENYRLCHK